MAKDHYVAQTYLKKFSVEGEDGIVNVVRKSNLERLDRIPVKSICREEDWSNTEYFPKDPRVVERFLKFFEPKWSKCVGQISDNSYDINTKYAMSGYLAYLRACTPTAVRLGVSGLTTFVKETNDRMEDEELANPNSKHRDIIKLIRQHGGTRVGVNPNYQKAMAIQSLIGVQKVFTQSSWIVVKNETQGSFITSDNPVCLQYHNSGLADIYCPLTPELAIVIHPLRKDEPREDDYIMSIKPEGVEKMNKLVVQSAEDKVIFNECSNVEELVKEYQDWRVEQKVLKIPVEKGKLIIHQQRPMKYKK